MRRRGRWLAVAVAACAAAALLAALSPWGLARPVAWPPARVLTASGPRAATLETRWIAGALEYHARIGPVPKPAWLGGSPLPARLAGDLRGYRSGCALVLELGPAQIRTARWRRGGGGAATSGSAPMGWLSYRVAERVGRWRLVPDCR